jgi:UDP-N-acetyl-D-galactosamine dehydrogenase
MNFSEKKIAIIGLGYVGLPLAVEFGKKFQTIGFDINKNRTEELINGFDHTHEVSSESLKEILMSKSFSISNNIDDISFSNFFIVTVPTPIDKNNRPNLAPVERATAAIAKVLKEGDIVVYESTVYPGVTEDICVPILEKISGLVFNKDFFVGYSPERINPGDKEHTLTKILKITSGSTDEIADIIDKIYGSIITAGTYKASSIKVAEAAKVIENAQRDINIAFVNELSKIFNLLKIDTLEVLEAAGTKWNFLKFRPGLVGGHCIGVDPYYLAQKAQEVGYHPEIILAGRRVNDQMGKYVASETIKIMISREIKIKDAEVLILGFTFKENCPDVRNTKVIDIVEELNSYGVNITIVDPWANPVEVDCEYGIKIKNELSDKKFDSVILAVGHDEFIGIDIKRLLKKSGVVYDVKGVLPRDIIDARL